MTVKEISETAALSGSAQALVKDDSTPAAYLDSLEKQELYQDAIKFQAYNLPVDAAIKWASKCIKELRSPESKDQKDEPLDAVDQWANAPADATRFAAKKAADKWKSDSSKLLAMAVYMSGGSLTPPGAPETPPPKGAAQKMIAGSIQVAVVSYQPAKAKERYQQALKLGKTPAA